MGTEPFRLLLIDGHSLAYRAFYALPVANFATTTGQPTNAVFGFTSMLINTLRDERPTHVAVAFDAGRHTFRNDRFPAYKATRSASPEGFAGQVGLIEQVLDAMGIVSLSRENFEADDIIATLATEAERTDDAAEILILTGDRDAFQLVDDRTTVLYPRRGVSDLDRLDPAGVLAKCGVGPECYADFAALRGDPSDNLPKVPGVGEKTAAKWIREYGSLSALAANADAIPGSAGAALRAHLDQVALNRELTELVRDVPADVSIRDLAFTRPDRERVNEVFDVLQFRTLRDRLFAMLDAQQGQEAPVDGGDPDAFDEECVDVTGPGRLGDWLGAHSNGQGGRVAVAVAGSWGSGHGQIDAVALAATAGPAAWFVPGELAPPDAAVFGRWLADPSARKAMHGAKGAMLGFFDLGWDLAGLDTDTEIAAYVLLPGRRSFRLADLVTAFLGRTLPDADRSMGQLSLEGLDGTDQEGARGALAANARAIGVLADVLDRRLADHTATDLVRDVELPLVGVLARMERAGIAVDVDRLRVLEDEYGKSIDAAERDAASIVGRGFNLGSPKQLQEILFEERGLPKSKRIKTGWTTDADALATLAATTDDPLPAVLLRWRDVTKLRQTVAGLIPLAARDGRIHTTFQQTVAATGRLSSTDPNLQNIPVRTEAGRKIRRAFVVGDGFATLLTADYSQIELRVIAHLSRDAGLIDAFRSGEDLHTTVASQVFGVPPADVGPDERRRIKAMSYGLAYGLSAFGLSQQLGISTAEAQQLMDEYFKRFGGVRDYLEHIVEVARRTGYTETMLGRRRYLPDLTSDNRQRREMAERMALNAPMQGSAADIVKLAMLRVDAGLRAADLRTRILLQVHDELICEVGPGEERAAREVVAREMSGAIDLLVPLEVSVGVGANWDAAAH